MKFVATLLGGEFDGETYPLKPDATAVEYGSDQQPVDFPVWHPRYAPGRVEPVYYRLSQFWSPTLQCWIAQYAWEGLCLSRWQNTAP